MRQTLALGIALMTAPFAAAAVKSEPVDYTHNGTTFKGVLVYDDAAPAGERRPGVLVFHEWWGLDDYARKRAAMLAEMGYVALCADMYGEGKTADHPKDAGAMAGAVRMNEAEWLGRAKAAHAALTKSERVDAARTAAIGYCFGGTTALKLAQAGAPLKAVATFHAALPVPTPDQAAAVTARVLVCHGADDTFIPEKAIADFRKAYDGAKVDYTFTSYPGAVHSFTVEDAGRHNVPGLAYNADADRASWKATTELFEATLKK